MHILMITDFYHPFVGGVEQHVRTLSAELVRRGHSVTVATLSGERLSAFDCDRGVRIHRLKSTTQRARWTFASEARTWAPPFPDPEITWQLHRIIARERPHIVHGHDWLARSFIPIRWQTSAKHVLSLHYFTVSCAKKTLLRDDMICSGPAPVKCMECASQHYGVRGVPIAAGNWLMAAAERRAVDMMLPVSMATAVGNGLVGSGVPYRIVPNFLPESHSAPVGDVDEYVRQLPAEPFLLFVGDLRRAKGIEILLKAYAGLSGAPPLVLIGKVWPESPSELPHNTVLLRNWPNEAVMAAWRRSLLGLVPSIWPEPFGIVTIEAMASGRPVIASRIGGLPEVMIDGETGLLVRPGSVEDLRQAMERLLRDDALRTTMGEAAQRRAERYRANAIIPEIEAIYAELAPTAMGGAAPPEATGAGR